RELAKITLDLGDAETARRLHLEALAAIETSYGPDSPQVAESHVWLAETLLALGKVDEAASHVERAKDVFGDHPDPRWAQKMSELLGHVRRAQGRLDEAAIAARKALELSIKINGKGHPGVANQRIRLAIVLRQLNRLEESEAELVRAVAALEKTNGKDAMVLAPALQNLAEVKLARDDCKGATPILLRTLGIIEKAAGPDHFNISFPLVSLGDCALRRGDTKAAHKRFERALAIRDSAHRSPMEIAEVKFWLAKVARKDRHRRRAKKLARQALKLLEGVEGGESMRREVTRWLK
ncbi:MAG TPA: tetratricopeptide repeat protein, partial [Kofleriaceae bacterium]|nr:tetratricopeptide repeat protein [Kofleriaceae bacterium]